MWNPDAYLEQLYVRHEEMRRAKGTFPARRPMLKQRLAEALGSFSEASPDLHPVTLERTECTDHVRERVEFGTLEGLRVPAYVLIPRGRSGRLPAVLALHGHGYGSREIVGLSPDGSTDNLANPGIHGNYALELVRRGMLVIAPEIIGFGDRQLAEHKQAGKPSCFTLAAHLLLYGKTLAGLRVHEVLRAVDYLLTREEADPARVGCIGFSGGGLVGAYASALDERFRATVLSGFTSTFRGSIMPIDHCLDNYIPGILQHAELPELIGLIAPRALFVESGDQDNWFPIDSVQEAVAYLTRIYTEAGVPERLQTDLFVGKHEVKGRRAYEWLSSAL